jgi:hypothetical protein
MSKHATIFPNGAADRLAIRRLVESYVHCTDRRDAKGQMSLFTRDARFVVYTQGSEAFARAAVAAGALSSFFGSDRAPRRVKCDA